MEKEVETTSKMVNPELGGGSHSFKETVYNITGDFFGWLSTHQGLALFIILIILGIMAWLLLRAKKYRRKFADEVYVNKKEIDKKDALIGELENKLANLQKKMSDLQTVVSEALLRTIRTLTGYDAEQLPVFFKSLTQISANPLQVADSEAITTPKSPLIEDESDDSSGINDSERFVSNKGFSEENDEKDEIASGDNSSEENDTQKDKLASDDSPEEVAETK